MNLRILPSVILSGALLVSGEAAVQAADGDMAPAFEKQGVAFLQKHCLGCHGVTKPKADLSLAGFRDDASVLKERKRWPEILKLVHSGEMPPRDKPRPQAGEIELFTKTVQDVFNRADRNAKPDPGRVTVRRLNRVEYNNTIRDLIGIDFNPAEDFPSDDVGHGFDNIGDVLTLSPVLMERYIAAAESIVRRAITPVPPPVTVRWQSTQFSEPAGPKIPFQNTFRAVTPKPDGSAIETGPIFIRYQTPREGDFNFRTRIYAETAGKQPVKVAILAGTTASDPMAATDADLEPLAGAALKGLRPFRIVEILEIKARNAKDAQQIAMKLTPGFAPDKMAIAIVKPPKDEPLPTVHVQFMSLDGPLDSRPPTHRKLLACDASKPRSEQTREILSRFLSRAYRRPPEKAEVDRLAAFVQSAEARGDSWEAALQLAFQAVLVSPKFLFRLELDDPRASTRGTADMVPLGEYELASRLSYFLWSSMPDDMLFDLAAKKQLSSRLDEQVHRMLKDPKAKALVDNFFMQWLQLRTLRNFQPDTKQFPAFNERLRAAMFRETELFCTEIVQADRSILELIDADFTYLNAALARHYGIADTAGNKPGQKEKKPGGKPFRENEFERVALQDKIRGGLLTQASVLAVTSNPTRTSPVKRGRWVLEQILGTPPPPPPPNVPELPADEKAAATGSLRQRLEQHRANPSCANCHARMDPIGFAFENFDAVGAFRVRDGTFPIDPSGELPDGRKFQGPGELKKILTDKKDLFARCLTEKMLIYATGRGLEHFDVRVVSEIEARLQKDGYRFSTLVAEIVRSDPFRMRRARKE